MQPLHPKVRQALKNAHPGLTDAEIDRVEALITRRFALDPEKHADEIRRLDAERVALIKERMPRYKEITRAFAEETRAKPRPRPAVRVQRKTRSDDKRSR